MRTERVKENFNNKQSIMQEYCSYGNTQVWRYGDENSVHQKHRDKILCTRVLLSYLATRGGRIRVVSIRHAEKRKCRESGRYSLNADISEIEDQKYKEDEEEREEETSSYTRKHSRV